jgi:hypothetical protein
MSVNNEDIFRNFLCFKSDDVLYEHFMDHLAVVYDLRRKFIFVRTTRMERRGKNMEMTITTHAEMEAAITGSERQKRMWTAGAMASAVLAIFSGVTGLIFSAASLFGMVARDGRMSAGGTVLVAVAFPLMLLTGHCMDEISRAKHAIRVETNESIRN